VDIGTRRSLSEGEKILLNPYGATDEFGFTVGTVCVSSESITKNSPTAMPGHHFRLTDVFGNVVNDILA
jgi:hypothetical protein